MLNKLFIKQIKLFGKTLLFNINLILRTIKIYCKIRKYKI